MNNIILDKSSPLDVIPLMGGKARNLYLMETQNIKIPAWFCVSIDLYDKYYSLIEERVNTLVSEIKNNETNAINEVSEKVMFLFKSIELDKSDSELILESIDENKFYAVRSSALGEDGSNNSFAGQLSSYLYIKKEDIIKKVIECWASAYTDRIIQYNKINNISHSNLKVAVIVQEMVHSKKSGVMFSVNPMMSDDFTNEAIITAGYGVGEGIVADLVETDTYTYNRIKKNITHTDYSKKEKMIVMGKDGGTVEQKVPSSLQNRSVLNHQEISTLVGQGTILYRFFGHEVDIEWAIDENDKLFFTQVRPITTLGNSLNKPIFFLDNSNVVESFPGVNTPWTLSIIRDVYTEVFTNAVKRLGISQRKIQTHKISLNHLIGSHRGHVFYNLTHWYDMMRLVPYTEGYIKIWEEMLGVEKNELSHVKNSILTKILVYPFTFLWILCHFLYSFFTLDFFLNRLDKKLNNIFNKFWQEEKSGQFYKYEAHQYIQKIESFKLSVFKNWDLTLINDIYAFVFTSLTKWLLKKSKVENVDNFFNDLMFGVSGMDSIAPVKSMVKMAKLVTENPELKSKLNSLILTNTPFIKSLVDNKAELKFRKVFINHIEKFGDRGMEELKLETITFREDPVLLMKMVLEYSDSNLLKIKEEVNDSKRKSAEEKLSKLFLKHPLKGALFPIVIKMAKRSINYRENFRLHRSRAYGIVRRISLLMGESLTKRKLIASPRDIFFLDYYSLSHFVHAISFQNDLSSQVKTNKNLYNNYLDMKVNSKYHFKGRKFTEVDEIPLDSQSELTGSPCSSGKVRGRALVVKDINIFNKNEKVQSDRILVAPMTDPGWVFLMTISKGLIVEKGSILSHTAIIGRELGIPTIVGVKNATKLIKDGDLIEINGDTGSIEILDNNLGDLNE
jgi:phosphoenolpyruvate synthase/pyruvate phosphate dikinase